jgi:hypothetical protein
MKPIFTLLTIALWLFNGIISAQPIIVKDIYLGLSDSHPFFLTNINGSLYFQALTATYGPELW